MIFETRFKIAVIKLLVSLAIDKITQEFKTECLSLVRELEKHRDGK